MSDEIIACPFCGAINLTLSPYTEKISKHTFVKCEKCQTAWTPSILWQSRPREDALQAEIDLLRILLQEVLDSANSEPDWFDCVKKVRSYLKGGE